MSSDAATSGAAPPPGRAAPGPGARDRLVEALRTIQRLQERLAAARAAVPDEPIAVVGSACRFPGAADSPEEYWHLLRNGREALREYPAERVAEHVDVRAFYDPDPETPGRAYTIQGAFLDRVDRFEPEVFGIPAAEARGMDPQQRLALEIAWETFERAGYAPDSLEGSRCGVYFGVGAADYPRLRQQIGDIRQVDSFYATGEAGLLAGRLSHALGLRGPSKVVDAACASSLVAVHDACQSLRLRECDMALAGGVNLLLAPYGYVLWSKLRVLSRSGRLRPFDARADGFVRGEGAGAVLLKRRADAVAAGDEILALIRGSAVNHDGHSSGLTVPNAAAQEEVIRAALAQAGVSPDEIGYVEAHGTGMALADQIELRALGGAVGRRRAQGAAPLLIGSGKSNIGHLEAAAGMAGLIKLILALRHGEIPPQLGFGEPNPGFDLARERIEIAVARTAWPGGADRVGAVSAFGLSGTNAHVVVAVDDPDPVDPDAAGLFEGGVFQGGAFEGGVYDGAALEDSNAPADPSETRLLLVSARTGPALDELAERYARHLRREPDLTLSDVCYTTHVGRARLGLGLAVVGDSLDEVADALDSYARDDGEVRLTAVSAPAYRHRKIAWFFPGEQLADGRAAGRALLGEEGFRTAFEDCAARFAGDVDRPLAELVWAAADPADARDPACVFALEYALARLWTSWGLRPSLVAGSGVGEIAAACVAGVFDLDGAVELVRARRRLATRVPSAALYSPRVRPALPAFRDDLTGIAFAEPRTPLVSTLTGELWTAADAGAQYWIQQAAAPLRPAEALAALHAEGSRTVLVMGPAPRESTAQIRALIDDGAVIVPSLAPGRGDTRTLLSAVGTVYLRGARIDWSAFHRGRPGRRTVLPTIPWRGAPHWFRLAERGRDASGRDLGTPVIGVGTRVHSATPTYELSLGDEHWKTLMRVDGEGRRYLPLGALIGVTLAAAHDSLGGSWTCVEDVVIHEWLPLRDIEHRAVQVTVRPVDEGHAISEIRSITAIEEEAGASWRLHGRGVLRRRVRTRPLGTGADRPDLCVGESEPGLDIERSSLSAALSDVLERAHHADDGVVVALAGDSSHGWIELMDAAVAAVSWAARPDPRHPGAFVAGMAHRFGGLYCSNPGRVRYVQATAVGRGRGEAIGAVEFFDEDGTHLGAMHEVHVVPPTHLAMRPDPWRDPRDLVHTVRWSRVADPVAPPDVAGQGFLLVGGPADDAECLARCLRAAGAQVSTVSLPVAGTADDCEPDEAAVSALISAWCDEADKPARVVLLSGLDAPAPEHADTWSLEEYLAHADLAAVALVRLLAAEPRCAEVRLSVITRGAVAVRRGDTPANPVAATLWGLGRVLAAEQPDRWGGAIDLDLTPSPAEGDLVIAALAAHPREDEQALRDGGRYAARLAADPLGAAELRREPVIRPDGTYLVTGAFGGRGLLLAHWLARAGAGRLVLVDGEPVPERADWYDEAVSPAARQRAREVRELELLGVDVDVMTCDVTDAPALAEVFQTVQAGPLPLRGVVHAAAMRDRRPLARTAAADYRRVVRPGLIGGWLLHELSAAAALDFFVCFATTAGVWGTAGQAARAAADAFAQSLAAYRTARRMPGLAVAWGPWTGTRDLADAAAAQDLRDAGVRPLSPSQCLRLLGALITARRVSAAVCSVDWPRCLPAGPDGPPRPVLRDVQQGGPTAPDRFADPAGRSDHPLAQRL
ncbi:MAG TPA: type I polyketide synthase [Actinocrinis sp.]|nr:type I polyketide synthase [Actinocrinis sp.]